jgi:CRISPR-associated protein Cas1
MPHAEQLSGELVIEQGQAFRDPERRLTLCKAIVDAKTHNMLSVLAYYRRRNKDVEDAETRICELRKQAGDTGDPETLMGFEGMSARTYYGTWKHWLNDAPANFTRVYHPPDNPLNAMISFLNSMLYTACVSELHRTALYPGISYMHAPQSRRFSLALDLVEPFKPLMVDRLIFRLFNHGDIGKDDFHPHSNGVLLKDDSRKRVLQAWDEQLKTTVEHPALKRSVSYRQLIRLDCYKLIKHLLEGTNFEPYRIPY